MVAHLVSPSCSFFCCFSIICYYRIVSSHRLFISVFFIFIKFVSTYLRSPFFVYLNCTKWYFPFFHHIWLFFVIFGRYCGQYGLLFVLIGCSFFYFSKRIGTVRTYISNFCFILYYDWPYLI